MMSIKTNHFTWNFSKSIDGAISAQIRVSEKLYQLNTKKDLRKVRDLLIGKALEAFEYEFRVLQKSL